MKKKLVIGITAPQSEYLLRGQLEFFSSYYNVFLIAPQAERITTLCSKEGATHLPISIKREISIISDVVTLFSLVKIFIKLKPDIVNLGTPKVSLLGMIAAKLTGVPLRFYTCRGFRYEHETGITRKLLMYFERLISSFSHNVICISKSVQEIGLRDNIFKASKSVVLGYGSSNGVDLTLFNPKNISSTEQDLLRSSLNLTNKFVIGFVGRLVDRKGIKELYEAFDLIYLKDSNLRLVMVGRTYSDQISNWDIIEKYNSHPGIIMTGLQPLEKIPLYLSLFNFFVLPAYWEGFGNVLIQASAMGLPIISTNVTGCKDSVKDGYSGILVEPYSVMKLKEGMEEFIANSTNIEQYGINGIKWASNFEPEILWERMQDLYLNPDLGR